MNKELLQQIILDFHAQKLETGVPRRLHYEVLPGKAFVCIGVRRCGKSTFLYQIMRQLEQNGTKRENILYLNFFDDRLWELKQEGPGQIVEAYFSLFPNKQGSEKIYCFFDEIQEVSNWEPFIDRLLRTENVEVYLSGSSAKMLAREISTQMRGRSLTWELFPFSFKEFLDAKKVDYQKLATKNKLFIEKGFSEYFRQGGFPEVLEVSDRIRIMVLQEYYKTILHRDIIERFDVLHPKAVMEAGYRLISSAASLYSINRITDYLKSLGHKVSKTFVGDCLAWFEDAYFLFSVKIFSPSVTKQNVNPKKIYCIDHGMIQAVTPQITEDRGRLLENMVFIRLRRRTDEIYYYRTKNGREVDFAWLDEKRKPSLAQVTWSLRNEKTRKREITGLVTAMKELDIETATIVTLDEEEEISRDGKRIQVLPAWKFQLE
ncbi:MAG: ATP-binding protein [Desulfobulbaceae bacterium]|nr:ATP-binding protein [Desulfobulbaceae bacterium]